MYLLVTGATGFVGARLGRFLTERGHRVRLATRRPTPLEDAAAGMDCSVCGDINGATDWSRALRDVEVVIHMAAPAHMRRAPSEDELDKVNVDGGVRLFRGMHEHGVRRMVYLSTVKVYGERSTGRAFTRADEPRPEDAYARSKWKAEKALTAESERLDPELVVVRAPLVHGPGAKGNLRRLMKLIRSGVPLPLKSVNNKRSMVGLHNLHDFLETCANHPRPVAGAYPVSDGEDVSTPDLIRVLSGAMNRSPRLWPMPPAVLRMAGRVTACRGAVGRLCDDLQVDIGAARRDFSWTPSRSLRDGLREMAGAA